MNFYFLTIKSSPCPATFVIITSIIAQITAPAQIISQNDVHAPSVLTHRNTPVAIKSEIKTPNFAPLSTTGTLNLKHG